MSEFLDWVKMRSHLFRGVTFGTMLRDEAYHFIRLGTHIERADNTARILDVKYHILLPSAADVGGAVDYYQWGALLRSVSGFESYRKIYSDVITPRRVAELLILRDDMPRSLHSLHELHPRHARASCATTQRARSSARPASCTRRLHYGRTDEIIELGLHEYLMDFLERISALGDEISRALPRARRILTRRRAAAAFNAGRATTRCVRFVGTAVRRNRHDLLRCHVARRRDDLRVGFAHQRRRRPDRPLFQDARVRAATATA